MDKESEIQTILPSRQRFLSWPRTRLGWWAVGLGLSAQLLPLLPLLNRLISELITRLSGGNSFALGVVGIFMLLCGIAGGITGLIAVIRSHERSILTWAAILAGFFWLGLIVAEFLFPH